MYKENELKRLITESAKEICDLKHISHIEADRIANHYDEILNEYNKALTEIGGHKGPDALLVFNTIKKHKVFKLFKAKLKKDKKVLLNTYATRDRIIDTYEKMLTSPLSRHAHMVKMIIKHDLRKAGIECSDINIKNTLVKMIRSKVNNMNKTLEETCEAKYDILMAKKETVKSFVLMLLTLIAIFFLLNSLYHSLGPVRGEKIFNSNNKHILSYLTKDLWKVRMSQNVMMISFIPMAIEMFNFSSDLGDYINISIAKKFLYNVNTNKSQALGDLYDKFEKDIENTYNKLF